MLKKLLPLILLAVIASANASPLYLPQSDTWQGYNYYNENNLSVRLEYAVYDTQNALDMSYISDSDYSDLSGIGSGQFIYTYQIFTNPDTDSGYLAVDTFKLLGFDTSVILDSSTMDDGMNSVNDDGISLDADGTVSDASSFGWAFQTVDLGEGNRSYFLAFTSDSSPIAGSYEMTANQSTPVPSEGEGSGDGNNQDVPEPTTVVLMAGGMAWLLKKRKNV